MQKKVETKSSRKTQEENCLDEKYLPEKEKKRRPRRGEPKGEKLDTGARRTMKPWLKAKRNEGGRSG